MTEFDMKYSALRQSIIEEDFAALNDKQREAVVLHRGARCCCWLARAAARPLCSSTGSSTC